MTDLTYYPKRHMAPIPATNNSWQNDGQNYVWDRRKSIWRTWALGSPEWTPESGFPQTCWIEYNGTRLDQMAPVGTRITMESALGDTLWSGSCFVDYDNKLKRGYGHVYYFVSAPAPGAQSIMLYTANHLGEHPYLLGCCVTIALVPEDERDPGCDLRDARVFWDDDNGYLVMSCTIGPRFAFFKSYNGTDWEFLSTFDGPGPLVECPNIYVLPVRDTSGQDTGKAAQVILGAVQGQYPGSTDSNEACTAWIGKWDGKTFTAIDNTPSPIDYGPDAYATAAGKDDDENPYVGFWIGNWAYCLLPMPYKGFQNIQSIPRQCWIQVGKDGVPRVFSAPLDNDYDNYSKTISSFEGSIENEEVIVADGTGVAYRVDIDFKKSGDNWPEKMVLKLRAGNVDGVDYSTDLIIAGDGSVGLDRSKAGTVWPGSPNEPPAGWLNSYTIPPTRKLLSEDSFTVSVIVDSSSIESFFNGGEASLTALTFPPEGCEAIKLGASSAVDVTTKVSLVEG